MKRSSYQEEWGHKSTKGIAHRAKEKGRIADYADIADRVQIKQEEFCIFNLLLLAWDFFFNTCIFTLLFMGF